MTAGRAFFKGACALMVAGLVWPTEASAQVPPDAPWRTLRTEHFRVTFPRGLEDLARTAGGRAEEAWRALASELQREPDGPIDLLLTDHTDVSNGFSQLTPSNRIVVHARPPVDDPGLGFFDEWLQLVIVHELAHTFHLDRPGALGRVLRSVFGRVPAQWPFFPGRAVPGWVIEGLPTWYESRFTYAGRTRGTFHEMVMRTAALEGRFESLAQGSGASVAWPAGNRPYTYGSMFFAYLLERYGDDAMERFVDAVAGQWVPYRLDAAGRAAFGIPISRAWEEWAAWNRARADSTVAALGRLGPVTRGERLTHDGRIALRPRVSRDGSALAWAAADGRSDPQVRRARPDGSDPVEWVRTTTVPDFDWLPDGGVLFANLEYEGPYRTFSDLMVATREGGRRRLTRGARLTQPAAAPNGGWAVAVQEGGGTNALVRVDLSSGVLDTLASPDPTVHWALPAVSPDGRWIAATRWRPGAHMDVVVLDASSGRVSLEVTRDRAVDLAPAWSPDGGTLLWASDRSGILNVVAADVDPGAGRAGPVRMVTNTATGAAYPSVDPEGRWVYYSGYHADGWAVERLSFDPGAWPRAPATDPRFSEAPAPPPVAAGGEAGAYSPWSTLRPFYWEPLMAEPVRTAPVRTQDLFLRGRRLLGPAVGAQTSGRDLVGRHAYAIFARTHLDDVSKVDLGGSYTWFGLGTPVLGLVLDHRWDEDGVRVARREEGAPLDTLFVLQREFYAAASATFLRNTWKSSAALSVSGGLTVEDRTLLDNALNPSQSYRLRTPTARLSDLRVTGSYSTVRSHGLQMGPAEGVALWARLRMQRDRTAPSDAAGVPGEDRSVDEVRGLARGYLSIGGPGFAAHVVAMRVAGGFADGPNAHGGYFDVGGASGSPEAVSGMGLFGGTSLFFPVRGYPGSSRSGRAAWAASLEYRVPLALLNRGAGPWPLHADRVVASLFADAGNAWGPELDVPGFFSPRRTTLASVGVEVTADVLAFWNIPQRVRLGWAAPLVEGSGTTVYLRLGVPF